MIEPQEAKKSTLEDVKKVLQLKHLSEKDQLVKEFEKIIKENDARHEQKIQQLEKKIKNSLTWRIGRMVTAPLAMFYDLFARPVKISNDKAINEEKPVPESVSKATPASEAAAGTARITEQPIPEIIKIPKGHGPLDSSKKTFAGIFDTFTKTCFSPEFNILNPTPENWKEVIQSQKTDGLFIESAWHGNDNSWEYLTYKHNKNNNLEKLSELIRAFNDNGLPTIFWNKEDPVHFDAFVNTAAKFDYIFTTDSDCIPRYRSMLGHNQVHALPFAAQHKLQHPLNEEGRTGTVCFAGSYYNLSFEERKHDMDVILRPALDFGLDIFDRNFGSTGVAAQEYRFPGIYQPAIRGKLEFNEMIKAFKRYKVYLNVNSVKNSPTMFSRRVFELLACGTPVISTYSRGITDLLGEGTVLITESEANTRQHLEKLLSDEHYWWEKSLNGIRVVMESHTYQDRTDEIFSVIGFQKPHREAISFIIAAEVKNEADADYLAGILRIQIETGFKVFIKIPEDAGLSQHETDRIKSIFSSFNASFHHDYAPLFTNSTPTGSGRTYIAPVDLSNYYGKNYLKDYRLAIKYADARLLGKRSYFRMESNSLLSWQNKGEEFRTGLELKEGTLVIDQTILAGMQIQDLTGVSIEKELTMQGISIDPFNFLEGGRNAFGNAPQRIATEIGI